MLRKPCLGAVTLSFAALASGQASLPIALEGLPAARDISDITARQERRGYTLTCLFSSRISAQPGEGLIFDTRTLYQVRPDCKLEPLVQIAPADPGSPRELVDQLAQLNPYAGAYLRGQSLGAGLPARPVDGDARMGIRLPADLTLGIKAQQTLRTTALATPRSGSTLPADWATRRGLLAPEPRGAPEAAGFYGLLQCGLRRGVAPVRVVPRFSIILTDTRSAYYTDGDCRIHPLVLLPSSVSPGDATGPGGRHGLPPEVTNPPGQSASPAGGLLLQPATAGLLMGALGAIGLDIQQNWQQLQDWIVNSSPDAHQAILTHQNEGLSATERGKRVVQENANHPQDDCDKLHYEIDMPTCNAVGRARGAAAAARCIESAVQRYAACIQRKPLPPLNTWN